MNTAQLSGRKSTELQLALKQQQPSGAGTKGFTRVAEAATALSRPGKWAKHDVRAACLPLCLKKCSTHFQEPGASK